MIKKLRIADPDRTPVHWWSEVEALKGREEIEFNPDGLTIIWGPNGSGKSTILLLLARLTHCAQAGIPKITMSSVQEFSDGFGDDKLRDGASLLSDGKPTFFYNPVSTPGLIGGQFDDDFFQLGIASVMTRGVSAGENTGMGVGRIINSAIDQDGIENGVNSYWTSRSKKLFSVATRGIKKTSKTLGKRTILLDEPERSLDIPRQVRTWGTIKRVGRFQMIIATHSPFALWIEGAKYIDIVDGYLEECREAMKSIKEVELEVQDGHVKKRKSD